MPKRRAMMARVDEGTAEAIEAAAHALKLSVSDYLGVAGAEKVARDGAAVSLAHSAADAEIARLSALATSLTAEISGKRGRDA